MAPISTETSRVCHQESSTEFRETRITTAEQTTSQMNNMMDEQTNIDPSTTTLSTIVLQSGQAMITIALLKAGQTVDLKVHYYVAI